MAGDRVKVAFALFNVPVRFTVLPLALKLPSAAVVNDPPRFTVAPLAVIVPLLTQLLPSMVSVWPLAELMVPSLTTESAL